MTDDARRPAEPSRHQQALTVWITVLPTLTVLQLLLGGLLAEVPLYLRPPILVTLVVPIVIYVLMPWQQRLRTRMIKER
jgi:antibiotic biosynthesis monooxygenase (ABM) superfamily enzyme